MDNLDEMDYVKRILDGDTNMFSVLLERHERPVHSLIMQIIPSREDAEELTQDTFIKAFRKLDTFKGDCSFSTWLYRIAYNTAISATRKKKVSFPLLDDNAYHHIPDDAVDELLDKEENEDLLHQMEKALELLNMEEKALITLYYTEEKPIQEISSILQITPDNVKVKLYRTRKKIYTLVKSK